MTAPHHRTPEQGKRALAAVLIHHLQAAGLTLEQLADRANLSPADLIGIERAEAEPD